MSLPDLEAWAIFAKVAETGSFAGAAADLGITGPTVSKAISRLEARFGEKLIHRTSRRFALTETGRVLAVRAAQILAEGEAVEAEAQAKSARPRGRIRLAVPMSFGLRHVAPALPDFLAEYPDISVDLHLDDRLTDLVAGGIDVAMRIADLPDSGLVARRLCPIHRYVVGSPDYFAQVGRPDRPRDLSQHRCFGYSNLASGNVWHFRHKTSGLEEAVSVSPRLSANNAEALTASLEAGEGLALQPDFIVWDAIAAGRLAAVLPDWESPSLALHLVTPAGGPRPIRTQVLIDFLVSRFASGAAPWTRAALALTG
ncbi:LysR family transcriptional regulator [Acidisoma cellulosilytica]|uniref:LysR family transcriptional regulator n=1 Tax=Acidisoma cellulosilyticum TaxID=2802395 RepID=A0A963Z6H1_9PROT|nr:LysR family transcriptional regulator [Acidisoma cellulosilyticum]MCB8883391.1 LysR family transcriptional regulator [Acidisoma cellulosilyticum]